MTWKEYKRTSEKELIGRKGILTQSIKNGYFQIPKGATITIIGKRSGLDIKGPDCKECGVCGFASKVDPTCINLIPINVPIKY